MTARAIASENRGIADCNWSLGSPSDVAEPAPQCGLSGRLPADILENKPALAMAGCGAKASPVRSWGDSFVPKNRG